MHAPTREATPVPAPAPTPTPTFVPKATSQLKAQAPTFQPSKPSTYLQILMRCNLHPMSLSSQNKELGLRSNQKPQQNLKSVKSKLKVWEMISNLSNFQLRMTNYNYGNCASNLRRYYPKFHSFPPRVKIYQLQKSTTKGQFLISNILESKIFEHPICLSTHLTSQ